MGALIPLHNVLILSTNSITNRKHILSIPTAMNQKWYILTKTCINKSPWKVFYLLTLSLIGGRGGGIALIVLRRIIDVHGEEEQGLVYMWQVALSRKNVQRECTSSAQTFSAGTQAGWGRIVPYWGWLPSVWAGRKKIDHQGLPMTQAFPQMESFSALATHLYWRFSFITYWTTSETVSWSHCPRSFLWRGTKEWETWLCPERRQPEEPKVIRRTEAIKWEANSFFSALLVAEGHVLNSV